MRNICASVFCIHVYNSKFGPSMCAFLPISYYFQHLYDILVFHNGLVKEIVDKYKKDLKWQGKAIEIVQEAAEAYLGTLFEEINLCEVYAKQVTICSRDVHLARHVMGGPSLHS